MIRRLYQQYRKTAIWLTALSALGCLSLLACDHWVSTSTDHQLIATPAEAPSKPVALVLGTAKKVAAGRNNLFYQPRIDTAAELYHLGKVRGIIVSGDHGRKDYNEPQSMKDDLIALGVPAAHITCDYAGFDTLDSVHRIQRVFGHSDYLIVSQAFHLQRALFIAADQGHTTLGVIAPGPTGKWAARVRAREVLARVKAVLETKVLNSGPRFLGPKETVALANRP